MHGMHGNARDQVPGMHAQWRLIGHIQFTEARTHEAFPGCCGTPERRALIRDTMHLYMIVSTRVQYNDCVYMRPVQ